MPDHVVMFCDAIGNFSMAESPQGRITHERDSGHRVGIMACTPDGHYLGSGVFANRVSPDQYAAACWAVLRASDIALNILGATTICFRTQQIHSLRESRRDGYRGSRYLEIARVNLAKRHVACYFAPFRDGQINLAEFVALDGSLDVGVFRRTRW